MALYLPHDNFHPQLKRLAVVIILTLMLGVSVRWTLAQTISAENAPAAARARL